MKHMNSILTRVGILLLTILLCCAVFASCNQGGNEEGNTTDETTGVGEMGDRVEKMDFSDMDLSPYITLGQYKNIEASLREMEYIVSLREAILEDGAYLEKDKETDVPVKEGDVINVDYTGYLDGMPFDGGKASNQDLIVFEGMGYIEGFASGFIGAVIGEKSSFDVTFPEDYGEKSLAGAEVTFEFEVNCIYVFDELTDEIANDLSDGAYPTAEAYEAYLRHLLVQAKIWPIIVENATVKEYPTQQVTYYYQMNRSSYEYYATIYGMTYTELLSAMGLTDAQLYDSAKLYVEEDLVYYMIRNSENIELTQEEYDQRIESYKERYKNEFNYTDAELKENLPSIEDNMLYDKVQETIVGWANVTWIKDEADSDASDETGETTAGEDESAEDDETTGEA